MNNTLQYISAKITRLLDNGYIGLQGSGTIIQSHGKYYLLTAYHCLCKKDDDGSEIIPADWKKMTATVYTSNSEYDLHITGLEDMDSVQDWAVLKIERPDDELSANTKVWLTDDIDYPNNKDYASYGFPSILPDGIYLEFTPTNNRGTFWRIHDTVEGGNIKAITIEKGSSGMGLFRKQDDNLICLGLINKSVPGGAMNAMQRVFAEYVKQIFDDIYISSEQKSINPQIITEKQLVDNMVCEEDLIGDEQSLCYEYSQMILQGDYEKASKIAELLYERHPDDENILLNLLYTTASTDNERLKYFQEVALNYEYSVPEAVAFAAKVFSNCGYQQIAADIFYKNAMRLNDSVLDSLYFKEVALNPALQEVASREYDTIEEGKCVLYRDEKDRRHCWMISQKSEMGRMLIGHHPNDTLTVSIAGEERKITIIAVRDKYFAIEHRALTDVMEHGSNGVLTPLRLDENQSDEEKLSQLLNFLERFGSNRSIIERMRERYLDIPSLLRSSCVDDLVPSFYYLLFSDFPIEERPSECLSMNRFKYINNQTEFVLDLSSFLVLSEKFFHNRIAFSKKFIISKYAKVVIEDFCNNIMQTPSLLMHQVLSFGKIYKFSDDAKEDMEQRIKHLRTFIASFCVCESEKIPTEMLNSEPSPTSLLFLNTMVLLRNKPNRVLISEDWYYTIALKQSILQINSDEFMQTQNK